VAANPVCQTPSQFLAIKNWEKYQYKLSKGKNRPWIRDYTDQDNDPTIQNLTCLQRFMLQACRRLCGRFGGNLVNDPTWIVRASSVLPSERAHAVLALRTLIGRGFLIPTNQQHSFSQLNRGEESTGEREESTGEEAQSGGLFQNEPIPINQTIIGLPLNDGTEHKVLTSHLVEWKQLYPAVDIECQLRKMRGWLLSNPTRKKTRDGINRFINSWLAKEQDNNHERHPNGSNKHERAASDWAERERLELEASDRLNGRTRVN
jgi:hypothetical protein